MSDERDVRACACAVKAMRYNEGALLFTIRALNRCLRSLPGQTEDICRHEFRRRGPQLHKRLQALLAAQPDPARAYGSAGFLRMLNKLLPTTEETMRKFVGSACPPALPTLPTDVATQGSPTVAPASEPEPEPEPEPKPEPGPEQDELSSDDDDL